MTLSFSSLSGGTSFTVITSTGGSKTATLTKTFPAGTYLIESMAGDTNLEIYLGASDGTQVGSCVAGAKSEKDLKRYYSKKEEILIKNAEYRKMNHESKLEIERASRDRNKEKNRPSKNARQSVRNRLVSDSKYVIIYKDLKKIYSQPCLTCGDTKNQSLDHKVPLSRGGEHRIGNIMTLCQTCNSSKNARTIMEWKLAKIKKGDD